MTTQLLIYETAVPVSSGRHAKCSVEVGTGFAFTRKVNSVPLMAVEFPQATPEYAVVFAQSGDDVVPVVILGARQNENLYLADDDAWRAKYVPAFIRRYPFVFSASADRKTLTLCIDESSAGFNREGRGQRLFDDERKPAVYTQRVLKFLQDFQTHFQRTRLFCQRIKELGILEPSTVRITAPGAEKLAVGGFLVVDRKKLRELPGDKLAALAKTDELELLYLHLYSLRNFSDIKDRLLGSVPVEADEPAGAAVVH